MTVFQERNRTEIRQSIVRALGGIVGTAVGTQPGDNASLIDTYALQGGDDEHNGRSVYMTKVAGVAATDKTWVSDYAGSTHDATLAPVVSGIVAVGDTYEMYPRPFNVDDVHDAINRAIIDSGCFVPRVTDSNFTSSNVYEYDWIVPYAFGLDFKIVHKVEYVRSVLKDYLLTNCETAWTAGGSVTATADATMAREGTYCAKLAVGAGAATGAVLGYLDISSVDLSDCDRIEFDMYSSINLTAGYLDFVLDNTAGCISPVESLDIPAMSAGKWYRQSLTMANQHLDTAIISLGVVNTTDVGACTLYFDNIHAVKDGSKKWEELNPAYWEITKGDTPKLKIDETGLAIVGNPTQIRISGFSSPDIFSDDTTDCEIDPEYVTAWSLAHLLLYHARANQLDLDSRQKLGEYHLSKAEQKKRTMTISLPANSRFV